MKNYFISIPAFVLCASLSFTACKKDSPEPVEEPHAETGTMRINFVPMFGDSLLELNTEQYVTANSDTLEVSAYKYYISNVVLTYNSGSTYTVPDGYFLINAADAASQTITLSGLPEGAYTNVSFLIGIDSARNVSGTQTGALDPSNGMFWTWSSGYIMAKLEGTSPQSTASMNMVMLHIGGFSGANSALRNVNLALPVNATVSHHHDPLVTVTSDAGEWFGTPTLIDLSTSATTMMPGPLSVSIANNYSDMFVVTSVQN